MSSDDQLEFHLPAPPVTGETPLIPARVVNEFVYCPRLAYLMWTQGEWSETGDTVEGRRIHTRVDRPSAPLPAPRELLAGPPAPAEDAAVTAEIEAASAAEREPADKIISRSLTLSSSTLGVIAKIDLAEAEDGVVTPVDYKRGRRPHVTQGAAKIANQRTILRRNWRGEPDARQSVLDHLMAARKSVDSASTISALLGIEGDAAATYFRAFAGLIKAAGSKQDQNGELAPFRFDARNRRPPTDPVNAMLSLAYAMLTRHLTITLASVGLDPYRGFYHAPRYGRPALALDVMEPFRPIIADSVVLSAINTGEIGPSDFVVAVTGTGLTQSGRRRFVDAFERRLSQDTTHPVFGYQVSMRRMLLVQARLLSRFLLGELPSYPHYLPR